MNIENFDNKIPYKLGQETEKKILTPELVLMIIVVIGLLAAINKKGSTKWI